MRMTVSKKMMPKDSPKCTASSQANSRKNKGKQYCKIFIFSFHLEEDPISHRDEDN
jgi:hypothetical protein